jgi:hypothetical protein
MGQAQKPPVGADYHKTGFAPNSFSALGLPFSVGATMRKFLEIAVLCYTRSTQSKFNSLLVGAPYQFFMGEI